MDPALQNSSCITQYSQGHCNLTSYARDVLNRHIQIFLNTHPKPTQLAKHFLYIFEMCFGGAYFQRNN